MDARAVEDSVSVDSHDSTATDDTSNASDNDRANPNPHLCQHSRSLIPNCATKHWKWCGACYCGGLLVVIALALALLGVTINWGVKANQTSDYNVTLSTYKEVLKLSAPTDHIYQEELCISAPEAPNSPPFSTQVQLITMNCSEAQVNASFDIKGVLLAGLQSDPTEQLVDHDLVFYWYKGTHIKLSTSLINFDERGVTIYILTDRKVAYLCSVDHVIPQSNFYVGKWPVNLGSEECKIYNNTTDFFCEFDYEVTRSDTYFVCFYRTKYANEDPRRLTYTYTLTSDLTLYDTSLARSVQVCDLNFSNASCCASYGLRRKECHFVKADVPNNDNDLGVEFTVTVFLHKRLHAIVIFVVLLILCVIIAIILCIFCWLTYRKVKNENARGCVCSCHLYGPPGGYAPIR